MKYIHYTEFPFVLKQRTYKQEPGRKPTGLWVSSESGNLDDWNWVHHCENNAYFNPEIMDSLNCESEIVIHPEANLLRLDTIKKIRDFSQQYAYHKHDLCFIDSIDWTKVAFEYQGIIITPYHRTLTFELICGWYYGWDCASGCIWDLNAIEKVVCVHTEF